MNQDSFERAPVLTASQMKRCERQVVQLGKKTYKALMERAGEAVVQEILKGFSRRSVLVLCGPGNNGGDGYVVARKLKDLGWDVVVAHDKGKVKHLSQEAQCNLSRWYGEIVSLNSCDFSKVDLVVDALFGTGLQRPVRGAYLGLIQKVNQLKLPCVSVDIPSGVNSDTGEVMGQAIRALKTVALGALKQGHVLLPGKIFCGGIKVADIGLGMCTLNDQVTYKNTPALWKSNLNFPEPSDHKYTRGHLIVVGSKDMIGAARLAVQASRRIGAGIVTIVCPKSVKDLYKATAYGEIIKFYKDSKDFEKVVTSEKVDGILIGPGLEPTSKTKDLVEVCLKTKKPLVLDAGGLSCLKKEKERFFALTHEKCVLLPHEGEFKRLFPRSDCKVSSVLEASKMIKSTLLLKGADTIIASGIGECCINTNAPPFLATAGTGDVLAGMVAGLMVQGMSPFDSAAAATWIHGEAANRIGLGLIAEDIERLIPEVLKELAS
jgi:ADP-dependent NAD(P)H-hydrate dehydratase / NAD(P)H-hydrate epimerase